MSKPKNAAPNAVIVDIGGGFQWTRISDFKEMQEIVDGSFQLVPKRREGEFDAYVNEEGKLLKLASNCVAGSLLFQLGFATDYFCGRLYVAGNALIMSEDKRAFTKAQVNKLRKAHDVALCEECAAYDCFDSIGIEDAYCVREDCKLIICKDCTAQGRSLCELHR